MLLFVSKCDRGEHRGEGEGHEQRDGHREGNGQPVLVEETADHALHESDRHEDGGDRGRGSDDREPYFLRSVRGRDEGRFASLDPAIDRFDDDDGVVDQQPDRDRERHHADHVEREPGRVEEEEGRHDRGGNRGRDDQRRAQVAQEGERHQDREYPAEDDVEAHVAYRGFDEARGVLGDGDADARRCVGRQLRQLGP